MLPSLFSPGLANMRRVNEPRMFPNAGPRILLIIAKLNARGLFFFSLLSSIYGIPKEYILELPMPTIKIPTNIIPMLIQSFCDSWLSQSSTRVLFAWHRL